MTMGGNNGWQESLVSMLPKPLKVYSNTEPPTSSTPIQEIGFHLGAQKQIYRVRMSQI